MRIQYPAAYTFSPSAARRRTLRSARTACLYRCPAQKTACRRRAREACAFRSFTNCRRSPSCSPTGVFIALRIAACKNGRRGPPQADMTRSVSRRRLSGLIAGSNSRTLPFPHERLRLLRKYSSSSKPRRALLAAAASASKSRCTAAAVSNGFADSRPDTRPVLLGDLAQVCIAHVMPHRISSRTPSWNFTQEKILMRPISPVSCHVRPAAGTDIGAFESSRCALCPCQLLLAAVGDGCSVLLRPGYVISIATVFPDHTRSPRASTAVQVFLPSACRKNRSSPCLRPCGSPRCRSRSGGGQCRRECARRSAAA